MVIVRIWEGLGNQMFQYAYARALKERGMDVRLDLGKAYESALKPAQRGSHAQRCAGVQNFRITLPSIDVDGYGKYKYLQQDTAMDKFRYWMGEHSVGRYKFYEESFPGYSSRATRIRGNYYVKGWFQSPRYFMHIRNILLKEFTPNKKIKRSKELRDLLGHKESVSLHVRRGDYVKIQNTLHGLYYGQAVEYMKEVYREPVFFVFSDDLEWVEQNLEIKGDVVYVNSDGKLQDYEELFLMSRCSSNIIANSTFSWWAAWLNPHGGKHVIAPRKWLSGQEGLIPESWTVI
jgi:Glycosyl transferase family 11.